jgi:hypothetical protein
VAVSSRPGEDHQAPPAPVICLCFSCRRRGMDQGRDVGPAPPSRCRHVASQRVLAITSKSGNVLSRHGSAAATWGYNRGAPSARPVEGRQDTGGAYEQYRKPWVRTGREQRRTTPSPDTQIATALASA